MPAVDPAQGHRVIAPALHVAGYAPDRALQASTLAQSIRKAAEISWSRMATYYRAGRSPLALDGIKLNTSPTDFYPLQSLQLSRFKGEKWELFGDILSNEAP